MQLPPKVLNALINIRAELLQKPEPESVIITLQTPAKEPKPTVFMRHARRPNAWQRSCQRKDWSSPVY